MSGAWSWYIIFLVVLNIAGCGWLLWWTAKRRPGDPKPTDTSHIWDGDITEYNKPLPRWWINLFWITIVFGLAYLAWYPGLGNVIGYGKWTSQNEHAKDKSAYDATLESTFAPFKNQPIDALAHNPAAVKLGRSIFGNTCATCHGSSARGAIGYPDLTDDIWHWGGTPERVLETVLDGREGVMPEWGSALTGIGGENAVDYVVAYVRSLSQHDKPAASDYLVAQGKKLFDTLCVACHGPEGKGNSTMGAPDLTDEYWLYGNSNQTLRETIAKGRHGSMPAHRMLLGETRARLAAAYVWSLSHGVQSTGAAPTAPAAH